MFNILEFRICFSKLRGYGFYERLYRSEGFALTGYVVPGCVEDGTWMLWENSSVVAVVAAAVVVLALSFLDNFSKKSSFLDIFHQKLTFWDIFY